MIPKNGASSELNLDEKITPDDERAFPKLNAEQIDCIRRFGTEQALKKGEMLFERGERSVDFFVVLEGCIEILDPTACGTPEVVTVHEQCGFTGELDLFNDREILVGGRMGADERVIRVSRSGFREFLAAEPEVAEVVMRAFILRRMGLIQNQQGGVRLVGKTGSGELLPLQRFLNRNGHPLESYDIEEEGGKAHQILKHHGRTVDDCPLAVCPGGVVLTRPTLVELAECVGLTQAPDQEAVYDTVIVGAGPAGLAAAVYASSEGLNTLILEAEAPGGQAGTSSRIENYLGFPLGLSGQELAARAQLQAEKFGAVLCLPRRVEALDPAGRASGGGREPMCLTLDSGERVRTRSVVCATGARYRTLDLPDYSAFDGKSIHYAATAVEAQICDGREIYVVGGGNSAGQAAVFLSRRSKHVHMLVRGDGLVDSMSEYLISRIDASPDISVHTYTEIDALHGDVENGRLEAVTLRDNRSGRTERRDANHLFMMIGAVPNTGWVGPCVELDDKGFIKTGGDARSCTGWAEDRDPLSGESSCPGVFAVGDCRSGSVKRVASAVGEGSVCISAVHRVLAEAVSDPVGAG